MPMPQPQGIAKRKNMIIVHGATGLKEYVSREKAKGKRIGFLPTMGALHKGHISLLEAARATTGFTVCSIFVNPTQFNNPDDLKKYPRTLEQDIDMLEAAGLDLLFLPEATEIYPPHYTAPFYDLDPLDKILEGKYRPGHFQGVCQVVDILLETVQPDLLFLGEKDFQQCLVIKKLIRLTGKNVECVICPTLRESDGLAMSSRNMRLTPSERKNALAIFETLRFMKNAFRPGPQDSLKSEALSLLNNNGLRPEYVEIADTTDLSVMDSWDGKRMAVALIACYAGEVRLIDNMRLT